MSKIKLASIYSTTFKVELGEVQLEIKDSMMKYLLGISGEIFHRNVQNKGFTELHRYLG